MPYTVLHYTADKSPKEATKCDKSNSIKNTKEIKWLGVFWTIKKKLDGVGPVDNRLSKDKLKNFVKKNNRHVNHDM